MGAGWRPRLRRRRALRGDGGAEEPLATYPPVAFWGRGPLGRNYLLMPLQDIVDETYTVYFDFFDGVAA